MPVPAGQLVVGNRGDWPLPRGYWPVSAFRQIETRPVGDRFEAMLPGQNRYERIGEGIEVVPRREYSAGIKRFIALATEYIQDCMNIGRAMNSGKTVKWDLWEDQARGEPPARARGVTLRASYNITHRVLSDALRIEENSVLSGPFFECEPPGDDPTDLGRQIAGAIEAIQRRQIEESDFEPEGRLFRQAKALYGYAVAMCEYEKRLEARSENGQYRDEVRDRGTVFRTVMPEFCLYARPDEPEFQKQAWVAYMHEVTLPMLISEHITAVVGEDELVLPVGKYFNLWELYDKTKNLMSHGRTVWSSRKRPANLTAPEIAVKNLVATTVWTQELDAQKLAREAIRAGTDYDELYLELGIRPEDIAYCRTWKLTAVSSTGGSGIAWQPDILVQVTPNPYNHQKIPVVGAQCMSFFKRTDGLGVSEVCQYLQLALDTLFTLMLDEVVKDHSGMWVVLRNAFTNLGEKVVWDPEKVLEIDPASGITDPTKALARIGLDVRNYPQGTEMLDRIVSYLKEVSGGQRPPLGGRRTAFEIAKIITESTEGIQYEIGQNTLTAYHAFAKMQYENNRQFLDQGEAIRLAGDAGQKIEFVRAVQARMGRAVTAYPVQVKIAGRKRTADKQAIARVLTEMQRTPLVATWIQLEVSGGALPDHLQKLLMDIFEWSGVDRPDRYFRKQRKRTTEEVVELLRNGEDVEVDITRFSNPQEAVKEIVRLQPMADNPLVADYLARLMEQLEQLLAGNMAVQLGMGGLQGPGQGQAEGGPVGRALQTALPTTMPATAATGPMAAVKAEVPNTPVAEVNW